MSDNQMGEPVAWRELCRRLYVELFHCNAQMTSGSRPKWKAGKEVLDVLADAKTALEDTTPPQRTAAEGEDTRRAWVGLTDIEINDLVHSHDDFDGLWEFADAVEAKLKEKNSA